MKFNERLLAILKNFSTINQSLVLKQGKKIRTGAITRNIIADAVIDLELPSDACIYDLQRFLNTLSLYSNPEIEFGPDSFLIHEGKQKTRYTYAEPTMVKAPADGEIKMPADLIEVEATWADISAVLKAATVLGLPEIAFVGEDGVCKLQAQDRENPTADTFSVDIGDTARNFRTIFKPESLKLIQDDYKVCLAKGISRFQSNDLTYYIAVEKDSTFE